MAENSAETEADCGKFKEISGMARELVSAMYETVWTVNPQNDYLESLVSFLVQSTENICKPAGIRCRINDSPISENKQVHSEIRHNVILSVKETIHNVIKHSHASEIELHIDFDQPSMIITISDNGCGFDTEQNQGGQGLKNQQCRMDVIGGRVTVKSSGPTGTRVQFLIPIP
jgi:signal transduction histidine kinase